MMKLVPQIRLPEFGTVKAGNYWWLLTGIHARRLVVIGPRMEKE